MYEKELELARAAAVEAGNYLRNCTDIHVDDFEGKDVKLSADKESEKILAERLSSTGYVILSEECGEINSDAASEMRWIIDPLDGTANYWKGMKELSCVSVALWKGREPVLGVVYRFETDELFWGVSGTGAFCNEYPIMPGCVHKTEDAVAATGFPVHRDYSTKSLSVFIGQVQRFRKIRMLGAAAVMAVFVAAGRIDAYMEDEIMLWDIAAAAAIVKAAGGEVDIKFLEENKCICRCFANAGLKEDYDAQSI